jgi:cytochrome c-type biogenesis protein CcmE
MKKASIGVLVAVAVVGITAISLLAGMSLSTNASLYSTFSNAKVSGEDVHIAGKWVRRDEAHYDAEADIFSFYMADSINGISLVHYNDPMPVNFESADKIVVEGKYQDDAFYADKIFMKCPSKYKPEELPVEGMPTQGEPANGNP